MIWISGILIIILCLIIKPNEVLVKGLTVLIISFTLSFPFVFGLLLVCTLINILLK